MFPLVSNHNKCPVYVGWYRWIFYIGITTSNTNSEKWTPKNHLKNRSIGPPEKMPRALGLAITWDSKVERHWERKSQSVLSDVCSWVCLFLVNLVCLFLALRNKRSSGNTELPVTSYEEGELSKAKGINHTKHNTNPSENLWNLKKNIVQPYKTL